MSTPPADGSGDRAGAVPRDLPDQQAGEGTDDTAATPPGAVAESRDEDLPDTEETGTGPRARRPAGDDPDRPQPEEPTD